MGRVGRDVVGAGTRGDVEEWGCGWHVGGVRNCKREDGCVLEMWEVVDEAVGCLVRTACCM